MYPNTALSGLSGNPQMMVLYNLSSLFLAGDEKKGKTFVMDSISDEGDQPWQSYHTVFTNAKAGDDLYNALFLITVGWLLFKCLMVALVLYLSLQAGEIYDL